MVEKGWDFRDHGTWWNEWWIFIEATKICYFGLALSGIGSQPTRLSDVLNLKNLKIIWGIKLIFCFHFCFWVILENTLGQSICRIFYFWLNWLVNFNTGGPLLHCTYFFACIKLVACVLMCLWAIAHIKWRRMVFSFFPTVIFAWIKICNYLFWCHSWRLKKICVTYTKKYMIIY